MDVDLATGAEEGYMPKLKDLIMVVGNFCLNQVSSCRSFPCKILLGGEIESRPGGRQRNLPLPPIETRLPPSTLRTPAVSTVHVIQALMIQPCEELDLVSWKKAVQVVRELDASRSK